LLPQVRKNFKARRTFKKAILAVNMMKKLEKLQGSSNNNLRSSEDEKSS
jgi:hypothetical protein